MAVYKVFAWLIVVGVLLVATFSHRRTPSEALLMLSLTAASPFIALWTDGGLETPMLLAAVTVVVLSADRAASGSLRHAVLLCLAVGVAFWARYDSALFTVFPLGRLALARRRSGPHGVLIAATLATCAAGVLTPKLYFGHAWPTALYVKTPHLWPPAYVLKNAFYLGNFLLLSGAFVPFVLPARHRSQHAEPGPVEREWLAGGLAVTALYGLTTGSTHMMFSYRLFVPYLPALIVLGCERCQGNRVSWFVPAAVLAVQGFLAFYVSERSVNPTLLNLLGVGVRGPGDKLVLSVSPPGYPPYLYEYPREGARAYEAGFLGALRDRAEDIKRDWVHRAAAAERPPRVRTFAAGALAYAYPEAYVYDGLSSFRLHCRYVLERSADYVLTLSPRFGSAGDQLVLPPGTFELVSRRDIVFDAEAERLETYFQPHPEANLLPPDLFAPCRGVLRP